MYTVTTHPPQHWAKLNVYTVVVLVGVGVDVVVGVTDGVLVGVLVLVGVTVFVGVTDGVTVDVGV